MSGECEVVKKCWGRCREVLGRCGEVWWRCGKVWKEVWVGVR